MTTLHRKKIYSSRDSSGCADPSNKSDVTFLSNKCIQLISVQLKYREEEIEREKYFYIADI